MSVRVLAFFDARYRTSPQGDDPWAPLLAVRPESSRHFPLDRPRHLYDLGLPGAAADAVAAAKSAGLSGFVVDLRRDGERYVSGGAEALAAHTDGAFGLAFQWRNREEDIWPAESAPERAKALVAALTRGVPAGVAGKTILIVEGPKQLPDGDRVLALLRAAAAEQGIALYLLANRAEDMQGLYLGQGYDALVDPDAFDWRSCQPDWTPTGLEKLEAEAGLRHRAEAEDLFYPYGLFVVARMINRAERGRIHPRVFPSYHDWATKRDGGAMQLVSQAQGFNVSTDLHLYGLFLENAMVWSSGHFQSDERLVFLDSWNDWWHGSAVEPGLFHGNRLLNATRDAIDRSLYVVRGGQGMVRGSLSAATEERIKLLLSIAKEAEKAREK